MEEEKIGFNDAYKKLQANADRLRRQEDIDLDTLVPILEESAAAYAVCKERIAAVRAAIQKHLGDDSLPSVDSEK
jgi:exodeoxyribonuclease VII small subunit